MNLNLSIVALALLLQVGATKSPPPSPTPSKVTQDEKKTATEVGQDRGDLNDNAKPLTPTVLQGKSNVDANKAGDVQDHPGNQPSDAWIVRLTGALVLVAVVQVVVYVWQASLMKKGLKATQDAAMAATQSAGTVIELNRPWLDTTQWEAIVNPGRILIKCKIENRSNSPARIERVNITKSFGSQRLSTEEVIETVINPNFSAGFPIPIFLEEQDEVAINSANLLIQIRGEITYTDIFGKRRHKLFARDGRIGRVHQYFDIPEGAGLNDEPEWPKPK